VHLGVAPTEEGVDHRHDQGDGSQQPDDGHQDRQVDQVAAEQGEHADGQRDEAGAGGPVEPPLLGHLRRAGRAELVSDHRTAGGPGRVEAGATGARGERVDVGGRRRFGLGFPCVLGQVLDELGHRRHDRGRQRRGGRLDLGGHGGRHGVGGREVDGVAAGQLGPQDDQVGSGQLGPRPRGGDAEALALVEDHRRGDVELLGQLGHVHRGAPVEPAVAAWLLPRTILSPPTAGRTLVHPAGRW